jgi:hypothetical protein
LSWLARLAAGNTPDEVGATIAALVQARPGCAAACMLWGLDVPGRHHCVPATRIDAADLSWLDAASRAETPHWHPDRHRVAIRLCQQPESALLLLTMQPGHDGFGFLDELAAPLQLAGEYLRRALEWRELQHSHQQLERSETLQRALFAISDLAGSERDMPAMLSGIHAIVSTLMYAENFFIVLHNAEQDTIRFLYFIDVEDPTIPGVGQDMPLSAIEYTLTWYVISDGNARMATPRSCAARCPGQWR